MRERTDCMGRKLGAMAALVLSAASLVSAADREIAHNRQRAETMFSAAASSTLPFSFVYGGRPSSDFIGSWTRQVKEQSIDAGKRIRTLTITDPATHLEIRAVCTIYLDSAGSGLDPHAHEQRDGRHAHYRATAGGGRGDSPRARGGADMAWPQGQPLCGRRLAAVRSGALPRRQARIRGRERPLLGRFALLQRPIRRRRGDHGRGLVRPVARAD